MKSPYPINLFFKKKFTRNTLLFSAGQESKEQRIGMLSVEDAERYVELINHQNSMGNLEYKIENYQISNAEEIEENA